MAQVLLSLISLALVGAIYIQMKMNEPSKGKASNYYEMENDIKKLKKALKQTEIELQGIYMELCGIQGRLARQIQTNELATKEIEKGIKQIKEAWGELNQELSQLSQKIEGEGEILKKCDLNKGGCKGESERNLQGEAASEGEREEANELEVALE